MDAGWMQDGCGTVPDAIIRAWPHLPEHIRLAVLALVEPYRHLATPTG